METPPKTMADLVPRDERGRLLWDDAEWLTIHRAESLADLIRRKFKEDPGIPIFGGSAVMALLLGMKESFVNSNPTKANNYMMARVGFQGLAAGAIVYSLFKATRGGTKAPTPSRAANKG